MLSQQNDIPASTNKSQFFILTQSNGKLTIVKHFFLTKAMLAQTKLKSFAVGTCYEIVWGSGNKVQM